MKILLLGANGQLGSDILRVNKQEKFTFEIIPWTRVELDITDHAACQAKLTQQSFDILINCTGYHHTDQIETNAAQAFLINALSVKEIARICAQKHARFVHISTDYVFGNTKKAMPLKETDSTAPLNIYGSSKLMGEALAQTMCADTIIFRVASLFGVAGASGKGGNFIETMLRVGREKGKIRVVCDQVMSPTSTVDIATVILKALQQKISPGIYHAVNSSQASWYEFAKTIIAQAGVNAIVEPVSASEYGAIAMRPTYSALDNSKLSQIVGPISTWQDALRRYLAR
jgi:dTDP-4-dehydrorhamnose reductase